jgi:hypothetical protein
MKVSIKQTDFSHGSARTLRTCMLGEQLSGWTITGVIHEDYYTWVNYFEATHPTFGWIKGDYEDVIHAKSKKAYDHFIKNHPPELWDYADI